MFLKKKQMNKYNNYNNHRIKIYYNKPNYLNKTKIYNFQLTIIKNRYKMNKNSLIKKLKRERR